MGTGTALGTVVVEATLGTAAVAVKAAVAVEAALAVAVTPVAAGAVREAALSAARNSCVPSFRALWLRGRNPLEA